MQVQLQLRDGINLVGITTEIPAEIPTEIPSESILPKQLESWSESGSNGTSVMHASPAATEGWKQSGGNHH